MIAARVEPYPSAIWQWGLDNRVGDLNTVPLDDMRKCLLEDETVIMKRDGLHFHGLRYISPTAEKERWYQKAQIKQETLRKKIYFDRRTQKHIYVLLEDGINLEMCTLHPDDAQFVAYDWYEVEDRYAREADAKNERRTYVRQQRVNDEAYRESIVANATRETQAEIAQANPSKAEQLHGSGEYKRQVAANERRKGIWILDKADDTDANKRVDPAIKPTVDEITQRRLKLLDDNDE
jgi:hypothetical protein